MKKICFLTLAFLLIASNTFASLNNNFKDLKQISGVQIDLRYASQNNFVGKNLYGEFNKALLHRVAFDKLKKAVEILGERRPDLYLHVFDALRPVSVQKILFAHVVGTDKERYVANPSTGSVHNYGFAIDLTLADAQGKTLDMGTEFDNFTELAQPRYEDKMLKEGKLNSSQIDNRRLLRSIMLDAGFHMIPNEWWHFDALPLDEIKGRYKLVE